VPHDPNFNNQFYVLIIENLNNFRENPSLLHQAQAPLLDDGHLAEETTPDEVKGLIKNLKNTKAPGPDEVKALVFKSLPLAAIDSYLQ
jgi:hypothetical protein